MNDTANEREPPYHLFLDTGEAAPTISQAMFVEMTDP